MFIVVAISLPAIKFPFDEEIVYKERDILPKLFPSVKSSGSAVVLRAIFKAIGQATCKQFIVSTE